MNVASLELSRELYLLSGWRDDTYKLHLMHEPPEGASQADIESGEFYFTYFTLGYLLRKLPVSVPNEENGGSYYFDLHFVPLGDSGDWTACYDNALEQTYKHVGWADTPEDAALKLAIELFKQGILTREEKAL